MKINDKIINPSLIYWPENVQNEAIKLVKEEMASLKGKALSSKEEEAALKVADALSRMVLLGMA